jgi:membrane-bound inhibitor of C-type lysozyme
MFMCSAQSTISGKVVDPKGKPVESANIFVEGTYDGATSDVNGDFSFTTTATGEHSLTVTALNFESVTTKITVETYAAQTIQMRQSVNVLDAVVVTAGTFEAGDRARVSVLKPLDIVTTAGSSGDIVAALQTLPGTQTVGESGRLFVRGGEADETQTYVDGIRVAQPYNASANNLPTRGRFSPFLFSGISFSTGGYSAEFGEALSSVLLLNTQGQPDQSKTDIALMTVGLGLGHTQKWKKSSFSFNAAYTDLAPYQVAVPQSVDWNRPYQSLAGEAVYRYGFTNGLLKIYAAFDATRFDLNQKSIETETTRVDMNNDNFYVNASYKGSIGNAWQLSGGMSYGYNQNRIGLNLDDAENSENASHLKLKLRKTFSDRFKLSFGSDYFITRFADSYRENAGDTFKAGYTSGIAAFFTEADIYFWSTFAAKAGFRAAHNDLLNETAFSPRVSVACKISKKGQFSLAYGDFRQAPKQDYLKFARYDHFDNEKATHYIFNYQYSNEKQTLRAEAYYKQYDNLVKYNSDMPQFDSDFSNSGSGYAKGLDIFWRDGRTVKNLEYWVSYSYIDSERNYRNFPVQATPGFVADHNLSIVTKYWISDIRSQIGFTNTFSSGRPYDNPNESGFMASRTKSYNNLSFSWAYLLGPQKILYFSMSNVLGAQNVFGYEYASTPGTDGDFQRKAITPAADRFFFVGFFWTISDDKKSNQLDNL